MSRKTRIAVYPGSFDPITYGHIDIIDRSLAVFDTLIVAIASNPNKKGIFSVPERIEMIRASLRGRKGVEVASFEGLLVYFCRERKADVIVRGLRVISDFEFEFQMAMMNKRMYPVVETVFMMTGSQYFYLSSSIIKEVVQFGGAVDGLVPPVVAEHLNERFGRIAGEGAGPRHGPKQPARRGRARR
ncbi:MAG: pantetheine-phosphate adenylyltransferase [Deltaproteobacteria bacterium RBG_13_65_10]|nr:MAG: pantetheine-phosphate adenylyltransferase [Deltaproteobacteria bacterium RBG_13_65_10]